MSKEETMDKYYKLWEYVINTNKFPLTLSFDDIKNIADVEIDHSFLKYKKELLKYDIKVEKISLKERKIIFNKQL